MLRIQSDTGQTLQLEADINVEFELNSWLLSDSDDLPGSYSYPVSFPLSDQNRKFLKYTNLPETRATELPVSVWVNGIMLRKSLLSYKLEKSGASGYLKIDAGEIASKVRGKYLNEIFTEDYNFGSSLANLRLLMKASALAAPGNYPFVFFPHLNAKFAPPVTEQDAPPGYVHYDYINAWDGTDFLVNNNRPVVPFLYLSHVIEKVCSYFGFKAAGSFLQIPDVQQLTVYNTQVLPRTVNSIGGQIKSNLGLHLPYMPISDFLKALRDDFGLGIFFDTSKLECTFELYDTIRESPQQTDLTKFRLKGHDNELPDDKGYTIISYQDNQDDFYKSYEPVKYKVREGDKEIKASIGTLQMSRTGNPDASFHGWFVPVSSQKGNLDIGNFAEYFSRVPNHKNGFGLRLLSYRGMHPDENDVLYPYGTSVTRRFDQTTVGAWSLDANQKDSIFYKFTVPYYTFLAYARRVRYNLLVPISQARNLKMQDVYGIRGENSVLVKGLISRLNLDLPGKNGNILAKASMFLLLSPDPTPNLYLGEVFYVELIKMGEYPETEGDRELMYANYIVRVWADAARTIAANPTNLVIQYVAFINSTPAGGSGTVTEDNRSLTMSGHQTSLTGLLISDHSAAENIIIEYAIGTSADYIAL